MATANSIKTAAFEHGMTCVDLPLFIQEMDDTNAAPYRQELIDHERQRLQRFCEKDSHATFNIESFYQSYENIISLFKTELALKETPDFFLIDEMPDVFANKAWDSFSVDKEDEKRLGIKCGFYFKKEKLSHPNFELIIAHEIIHWIISENSEDYYPYVTLIEEGYCDFLSLIFLLKSGLVSKNAILNFIQFARSSKKHDIIWHSYWRNLNYLTSIALSNGIDYVSKKVLKGRKEINDIKVSENNTQDTLLNNFSRILCEANSILVLEDYEFYLLKHLIKNQHDFFVFSDVQKNLSTFSLLEKALSSLVSKGVIFEEGERYYNPYETMPENIKFTLDNELVTC